jgi:glycosyltransferase involved in cell wall biosynthesis
VNELYTIICAGFFADRHARLLEALSRHFELLLFSTNGNMPFSSSRIKYFQIDNEGTPDVGAIDETAKGYYDLLHWVVQNAGLACDNESLIAPTRFLLNQWLGGYAINHSLRKRHDEKPIAAVIAACDDLSPIRFLVSTAKNIGIPTFYINHGLGSYASVPHSVLKYAHPAIQPPIEDFVFVDSELSCDIVEGRESKRGGPTYFVTGSPLADDGFSQSYTNRSVRKDEVTIGYCAGWLEASTPMNACLYEYSEYQVYSKCCQLAADLKKKYRKINLHVKLHPTLVKLIGADISEFFIQRAGELGIEVNLFEGDIKEFFSQIDLLINAYCSATNEEAFYYGVPSLTCFTPYINEHIKETERLSITHLSKWGAQVFVSQQEAWMDKAVSLLENKKNGMFKRLANKKMNEIMAIRNRNGIDQIVQHILDRVTDKQGGGDGENIPPTAHYDALIKKLKEAAIPQQSPHQRKKKEKQKILMVVHGFPPYNNGGTELYTYNISVELKKLGHEVVVLHPVMYRQRELYGFSPKKYNGLDVIEFNIYSNNAPPSLDFFNERYDKAFHNLLRGTRFDIVHFQHLQGLSANWLKIAKLNNALTLLKLDDFWFLCKNVHLIDSNNRYCSGPESDEKCSTCLCGTLEGSNKKDVEQKVGKYLAARRNCLSPLFQQVDVVHSASYFAKAIHENYGYRNDHFRVVPTGILPYDRAKIKKHGDNDEAIHIGFMGHIALRKGILDFIESVKLYQSRRSNQSQTQRLFFHIWGKHCNDELFNHVIKTIEPMADIRYHGGFDPDDRKDIFSTIDLLVVPSSGENYPFIIREALFSSVPVVSTRIAAVPEIITEGINGFLFDQGNILELADIFSRLSMDANSIRQLKPEPDKIRLIRDEAIEIDAIYSQLVA